MSANPQVHVKLPPDVHRALKVKAARDRTSIQALTVRALRELLARKGGR